MREIKFRAWLIEEQMMINADRLCFEQFLPLVDLLNANSNIQKIMQYTGLKDKNGVEIYEGDIVKDSCGRLMIIEWDDRFGTARFILKAINKITHIWAGRRLDIHQWITIEENDLEVIGNIYENKELLNRVEK